MSENLGSASLELRVDLEKFQAELRAALSMVKQTMVEMKQGLNINIDNINFEPIKSGLKDIPPLADNVKDSVNNSLTSFAKFELITGVINQVKSAVGELKSYVMNLGKEYADAELTQEKLRAGLQRIGDGNYFEVLKKQADELHKITPFDDQDITNMQAMMTTFNGISGSLIERLTPSLLNLSSAFARAGDTGMNLQQLAIMIGKSGAMEISTGLQRVGIVMSETQKKMWGTMTAAQRFMEIENILANNSNITAEAFGKTLAGQIKIAENAFGDIKEVIGKAFAPIIIGVSKAVQDLAGWFGYLSPAIQATIGLIGGMAIAAVALIPILSALNISLGGLPIIIGAVVAAVAGIAIYISENIDSIKAWVTEMAGGEEAIKNLKNTISALWDGLKELWEFIVVELSAAWEIIISVFDEVVDRFKGGKQTGTELLGGLKALAKEGFDNLKKYIDVAINTFVMLFKAVADFIVKNESLVSALKTLAGYGFAYVIAEGNFLITTFTKIIDWGGRLASSLLNVVQALKGLASINLANLILNPDSFKKQLLDLESSITNIGKSFQGKTEITVSKVTRFESQPIGSTKTGEDLYADAYDREGNPIGNEVLKQINNRTKDTTPKDKPPGSKSSGKDKEELDALKDLTAEYDHQVKLMDDKVKLGEASVEQMSALLTEYREALTNILDSLSKTEDRRKAEEKIVDLKVKQTDLEKKYAEENKKVESERNKLIGEVDKFIDKRQAKVLQGIDKETAGIETAYREMERKVTESKLSEDDKKFESEKLLTAKTKELLIARQESQKSAEDELQAIKLNNSRDEYAIAKDTIDKKYQKEKERILKTYEDTVLRSDLLKQKDLERIKEVAKIETESEKSLRGILTSGFSSAITQIQNSFNTMWDSVFGDARSIFQLFIKDVMAELTKLAATKFFSGIVNFFSGGLGGIVTDFIGSFFGDGGYTGDGDPKKLAGFTHLKEFVVSEKGTSIGNNRAFLELANQGRDLREVLSSVMPSSSPNIPVMNTSFVMGEPAGVKNVVVNSGLSLTVNTNRLTGLQDGEWDQIVDEMMPQISKGLRRINKETLDGTIK